MAESIRTIAIVGGGTAGWSAAALFARLFGGRPDVSITLVESADIPTVGVGEATIPPIFEFLDHLGIDAIDFVRQTQATFKLAIQFRDWHHIGHRYWHPFGVFGLTIDRRPFFHHWWQAQAAGDQLDIADYAPAIALAADHRMALRPGNGAFPGDGLAYALHFDAGLVAAYLKAFATARGVRHVDARVTGAAQDSRGHVASLQLDTGEPLAADLYIDCSGFRGLLIAETLGEGYDDWRQWLPNDRAIAAPTASQPDRPPYTIAAARSAGWQWCIPLQHRVGNGYVYSSAFTDDAAAEAEFRAALPGPAIAEPRRLRFTPGRRTRAWVGNVVAIGLSAGFLEPLESTSIHLIHTGLNRLLDYFPDRGFAPELVAAYNRETALEYEHIRDFLILHYRPNQRLGEPFWDHVRNVAPPDSYAEKVDLIRSAGRIVSRRRELFADISWFFVAEGMGVTPVAPDPLAGLADRREVRRIMAEIRDVMTAFRGAATGHDRFLAALLDPGLRQKPRFAPFAAR